MAGNGTRDLKAGETSGAAKKNTVDTALENGIRTLESSRAMRRMVPDPRELGAAYQNEGNAKERAFHQEVELRGYADAKSSALEIVEQIVSEGKGDRGAEVRILGRVTERLDAYDQVFSRLVSNYYTDSIIKRDFPDFVQSLAQELSSFKEQTTKVKGGIAELTGWNMYPIDDDMPIRDFASMCTGAIEEQEGKRDVTIEVEKRVELGEALIGSKAVLIKALVLETAENAPSAASMLVYFAISEAAKCDIDIRRAASDSLEGFNGLSISELPGVNTALFDASITRGLERIKARKAARAVRTGK